MSSPTQRTLAYLRDAGYRATVVEHWNPFAHIRQDLFGLIDVLAVGKGITIGVQCCDSTSVSKRIDKFAEHENTAWLLDAGWRLEVHGWTKGKRGPPRIVPIPEGGKV